MATNQVQTTTGTPNNITFTKADLDTLMSKLRSTKVIEATDIALLIQYLGQIINHKHEVMDVRYEAFDNGQFASSSSLVTTAAPKGITPAPTSPDGGAAVGKDAASYVTSARLMEMVKVLDDLNFHTHTIIDTEYWDDL